MASRTVSAVRVNRAAEMLLEGRSTSAAVSVLADEQGISRRQARRYVAAAYEVLHDDIEQAGVNRRQMIAKLTHTVEEAMAKALASGHASAVVGCCRELRELLQLTPQHHL